MTPIEMVLEKLPDEVIIEEVLIPEQCAIIWVNDKRFHIVVEAL